MTTQIQAAVQREIGAAPVIETLVIDAPQAGEVLVAIHATGVCHTDMVMRDGHLPIPQPVVLGHEGAGVVQQVGEGVVGLQPGDHVVLSFDSCGHCNACEEHDPAYCDHWFRYNFAGVRDDGTTALKDESGAVVYSHIFGQSTFATHAIVKARNAVRVERDLPLELLGPLGCGIQTGAGTILNVLKPRAGANIAVIGAGAVGLSAIMAAATTEAERIVAIDVNAERVELAKTLGATHAFLANADITEHAAAAGVPQGFDYIIDTTGIPAVCSAAVKGLATRGELAMVGAYPPAPIEAEARLIMSGGRVIRGVVEGGADPQLFIPELIDLYRAGKFPFDKLVQYFDFADIAIAIEQGETGKVVKPIVRMVK